MIFLVSGLGLAAFALRLPQQVILRRVSAWLKVSPRTTAGSNTGEPIIGQSFCVRFIPFA